MGRYKKTYPPRAWTEEEVERLIDLRNRYTKSDIARMMKRSAASIQNKVRELELGGLLDNTDKWTFAEAGDALGLSRGVLNRTWVKHGLKFVKRGTYCLVEEKELVRFMQEHPDMWDATKCDYYLFYKYPWFLEKLEEDKKVPVENRGFYWTDYQKQQFLILRKRGFTYKQIGIAIGKTERAVKHHSIKLRRKEKQNVKSNT